MWALSPSLWTLLCFVLRLCPYLKQVLLLDSFNTKPTSSGRTRCTLSKISGKFTESTCRFTQRYDRILDTFTTRTHHEPHRVNE
jgi:hypothetical protein